jgi:hypothetical protein
LGAIAETVDVAWLLDAGAAATVDAEPARIAPAAPRATIAGMMVARPMRIFPPGIYGGQQPATGLVAPCSAQPIFFEFLLTFGLTCTKVSPFQTIDKY